MSKQLTPILLILLAHFLMLILSRQTQKVLLLVLEGDSPRRQVPAPSITGCPFPLPHTSPLAISLKGLQRGRGIVAVFGHLNATCLIRVESSFHIWKNPVKGASLCWKRVGCGQVIYRIQRGSGGGEHIFVLEPGSSNPACSRSKNKAEMVLHTARG